MEYYTTKCFKLENDYQKKIRKLQPAFLNGVKPYLDLLEGGDFCDDLFADGDGFKIKSVTPENCKNFVGGIT